MRGLHTKHKKNLPFHRRTITRRYFTERCKKITGFCHIHRWLSDGFSDGFSDANTDGITDGLSARMSDTCSFARLPTSDTDGPRMSDTCPSARVPTDHACLTRVRLHVYRKVWPTERKVWLDFRTFWCAFQLISDGITDGN